MIQCLMHQIMNPTPNIIGITGIVYNPMNNNITRANSHMAVIMPISFPPPLKDVKNIEKRKSPLLGFLLYCWLLIIFC